MDIEYKLFDKQRDFMNSKSPITYLCCGRGFGKSFVASLLIVVNFLQGKRIIALAQNYKALNEVLFQEIRNRLEQLELDLESLKDATPVEVEETGLYFVDDNGYIGAKITNAGFFAFNLNSTNNGGNSGSGSISGDLNVIDY